MFVHVGGAGDSIFLAVSNDPEEFLLIIHINFCEVLDEATELFTFSDFEVVFGDIQ